MSQLLKEECTDSVSKQTQLNVSTNTPRLISLPKNGRKLLHDIVCILYTNLSVRQKKASQHMRVRNTKMLIYNVQF